LGIAGDCYDGLIGGLSIFIPGILLVFFIFPLWRSVRKISHIKYFLNGVSVTAASIIMMTALTQSVKLPVDIIVYGVVIVSTILLLLKKIPAPLIVVIAAGLGFLI
jgi:chromate transporter